MRLRRDRSDFRLWIILIQFFDEKNIHRWRQKLSSPATSPLASGHVEVLLVRTWFCSWLLGSNPRHLRSKLGPISAFRYLVVGLSNEVLIVA